jgi:shikimate kinase
MSNIGKSHWAKILASKGYTPIACDALIERKLAPELVQQGYAGIGGVARWMGQPFDAQYSLTSAHYLAAERDVMEETLMQLKNGSDRPAVIDTTGSVIYTGDDIESRLRTLTRVVYLEASPAHQAALFDRYVNNPKPVIWGGLYAPHPGEVPAEALKRCFPELLRRRAALYARMAHVIIPYEHHRAANAEILSLIGGAL